MLNSGLFSTKVVHQDNQSVNYEIFKEILKKNAKIDPTEGNFLHYLEVQNIFSGD